MNSKTIDENCGKVSLDGQLIDEAQLQRRQLPEVAEDTSSSGTLSDEEDEDDSSSDDEDADINGDEGPRKLVITTPSINNDLKSRLSAFLPQIRKANKDLEDAGDVLVNQVEDVGEDEDHYIEMNLGLGVLCERDSSSEIRADQPDSEHESSDGGPDTTGAILQRLRNVNKKNVKCKVEEV